MNDDESKAAHKHSFQNKEEVLRSKQVGCFYCKKIYPASEVEDWIPDKAGDTAECPHCMIDSVIGDASGIEITDKFLEEMHERWFERTVSFEELKKMEEQRKSERN